MEATHVNVAYMPQAENADYVQTMTFTLLLRVVKKQQLILLGVGG
jgi:hypothetical protein